VNGVLVQLLAWATALTARKISLKTAVERGHFTAPRAGRTGSLTPYRGAACALEAICQFSDAVVGLYVRLGLSFVGIAAEMAVKEGVW
jgi:hypothetical protein